MATDFIPFTTERFLRHMDEEISERVSRHIEANVNYYATQERELLDRRLQELDQERSIEQVLEANAIVVLLIGLGLGRFVSRRWYLLPAAVAAFLLQHAVQGWSPPVTLLRRLGVRTAQEIDNERYALKALRGDFSPVHQQDNASVQEPLHAAHI